MAEEENNLEEPEELLPEDEAGLTGAETEEETPESSIEKEKKEEEPGPSFGQLRSLRDQLKAPRRPSAPRPTPSAPRPIAPSPAPGGTAKVVGGTAKVVGGTAKVVGGTARVIVAGGPTLLVILLIVLALSLIILIFWTIFGGGGRFSHILEEAGGSFPIYPSQEVEAQADLVDRVKGLVGINGPLKLPEGTAELEWQEDETGKKSLGLDLRLLLVLEYLVKKHNYLEVALLRKGAPDFSAYSLVYPEGGIAKEIVTIAGTAYHYGQAAAITAVDYSQQPEYQEQGQKVPIRVEWQKTIHQTRLRRIYEEIKGHSKFILSDLERASSITEEELQASPVTTLEQLLPLVARLERLKFLTSSLLTTPDLAFRARTAFSLARAGLSGLLGPLPDPADLVAFLKEEETQGKFEQVLDELFLGMRVANIKQWDTPDSLKDRKAAEARRKIREVVKDLLIMPKEISLGDYLEGGAVETGIDLDMAPKQLIIFSPEDDLDDGLEEDLFPDGLTQVFDWGTEFAGGGDGQIDAADIHFSHLPSDQGSFSKYGVYFLYRQSEDVPSGLHGQLCSLFVDPQSLGPPPDLEVFEEAGEEIRAAFPVSYARFIHLAF